MWNRKRARSVKRGSGVYLLTFQTSKTNLKYYIIILILEPLYTISFPSNSQKQDFNKWKTPWLNHVFLEG